MFLHSSSWLLCPYDALLDYLVNNYESNDKGFLYPNVNHVESRVNQALKKCRKEGDDGEIILPETTSHTIRRSGIMHANSNEKIKESSISMHAGLVNMANAPTFCRYNPLDFTQGSKVGRVMSGWSNADYGGVCPSGQTIFMNMGKAKEKSRDFQVSLHLRRLKDMGN